jgi:Ca2+-binding EF-hand superfamily protein
MNGVGNRWTTLRMRTMLELLCSDTREVVEKAFRVMEGFANGHVTIEQMREVSDEVEAHNKVLERGLEARKKAAGE